MTLTFAVKGRKLVNIWVFILTATVACAQDPQFSQFYANPLYTNPAFAGSSTVARGVLNYRSQWPGISGTFRTISTSYDEHFDVINGGIGVLVTADEAGVGTLRTVSASGIYSYQIIINKYLTIRAGIAGSFNQRSIDFSKLQFYDQIVRGVGFVQPTKEPPSANSITYLNFASGLIAYTKQFYAGFAVHNLSEPVQSFYGNSDHELNSIPRRYTAHAGLVIPLTRNRDERKSTNLWPNVIYMQQRLFNQLNLGMYYNKGPVVLGTYFRANSVNSDAIIFVMGFRLPKMRFGFSYDATVSEAKAGARQSYEVSLSFELKKKQPKKTVRQIRCPEF